MQDKRKIQAKKGKEVGNASWVECSSNMVLDKFKRILEKCPTKGQKLT
jgi:hypothetical protein